MTIENRRQLESTRLKLQELEELYAQTQHRPVTSEHVRELTLRSLKKRFNQFKEEITRFETRAGSAAQREPAPPPRTESKLASRAPQAQRQEAPAVSPHGGLSLGGSQAGGAGSPRGCWGLPACSASSSPSQPTTAPSRSRAALQ